MPVMSWCVSSCDKWPVWWGTRYQRGLTQESFPGSIELGQELPGCYRIPWGYSLRLVQGLSPKSLNNIFLSTLPFCLEIEKSLTQGASERAQLSSGSHVWDLPGPHQAESSRWSFQHPWVFWTSLQQDLTGREDESQLTDFLKTAAAAVPTATNVSASQTQREGSWGHLEEP